MGRGQHARRGGRKGAGVRRKRRIEVVVDRHEALPRALARTHAEESRAWLGCGGVERDDLGRALGKVVRQMDDEVLGDVDVELERVGHGRTSGA